MAFETKTERQPPGRTSRPAAAACAAVLVAALAACGGARGPSPRPAAPGEMAPTARPASLVGRIYDVPSGAFVSEAELAARLASARYVLLGERHDRAEHHRLQAEAIETLVRAGRRPVVALEMIEADRQPEVDAQLARAPGDADALGEALAWERSGWPPFALYRPVFASALRAGLLVGAANMPRDFVREVARRGPEALPPGLAEALGLDRPLPGGEAERLERELAHAHGGHGPPVAHMALAQRLRDAKMAERLVTLDRGDGAVLIAGAGHVRRDRGVPFYLARRAPGARVLSVAFVEVEPELAGRAPEDYAERFFAERLPFDLVRFTAPGRERQTRQDAPERIGKSEPRAR